MTTIAAIATAQGAGGIGIIRISGENAITVADKVFISFSGKKNILSTVKGYSAKYGKIIDKQEFIDDAVALVFRAPNSYTGENVVEISCHGGLYLTRRVLRAVLNSGAVLAEPGEFTKRAFLNGKMNLSQAESVMDLISAKGARASKIAFDMHEGVAYQKINLLKNKLIEIMAGLSVWADYPEDDIPQVDEITLMRNFEEIYSKTDVLIKNYDACKVLKSGVKTAIVGRPNVGKSTLMNLFAGHEKSIVTDVPGTTRDAIEETVMIGDIPLILTDTAGIRNTEDVVEKIGIQKARNYIDISDLTLLLADASSPLEDEDRELLNKCDPNKTIIILNKCDLGKKVKPEELSTDFDKIVEISATTGVGADKLKNVIEDTVGLLNFEPSENVISNERQLDVLNRVQKIIKSAISAINSKVTLDAVTVLLQDAIDVFSEFTGENVSESVINTVFSKFCVGK